MTGMEKSCLLYQYAKASQEKEKTKHNFERNGQKEKTVHTPNTKSHAKAKSYEKVNEIKTQKNINRMYEGRKFREQGNEYIERGLRKRRIPR